MLISVKQLTNHTVKNLYTILIVFNSVNDSNKLFPYQL